MTLASKAKLDSNTGMTSLTSIVAVGLGGEIGIGNDLPWRLKSDLRFFQSTTKGNVVIMGRKTFDSIGGCLPKRDNIILSHSASLFEPHKGCEHAHSIGETLYLRGKRSKSNAYVIGGALTYSQFADYVDRYLITVVNARFPDADVFFSENVIGDDRNWLLQELKIERIDDPAADQYDFQVFELLHKRPEEMALRREKAIQEFCQRNHLLKRQFVRKKMRAGAGLDEILSIA